jgi:peptidoglycan hydrolase CwlO-like protein
MRRSTSRAGTALLALLLTAALETATPPAAAADLATTRARAQEVADRVSALEHRLAELRARRARTAADVAATTRRIAALEARMTPLRARLASARARYVERAVEAYKGGAPTELALVLSADELSDLFDWAEAAARAAAADRRSLGELLGALRAQERLQTAVDGRKQRLLAAEEALAAIDRRMEAALARRRARLEQLQEEIRRLEERARLAALRAAAAGGYGSEAFAELLRPTGPATAIPDGYVGTGIVFEGIASWYGPGFEGEATANGQMFDPHLYTAASRDLPFGTILHVTYEGEGVVVVINDRGPYLQDRILDLSQAAAEAIGLGLGWVQAEIVIPEPLS